MNSISLRCLAALLLGVLSGQPVLAADPPTWKAGFATLDVTPDEPLLLAGYASRANPADGVLDELRAKALALEDSAGQRAVLVTADIIGFRAEFAEPLCARITAETGIPRERIILNASHTHTGPSFILSRREGGSASAAQTDKLLAYARRFQDQCVALATQAVAGLAPARLSLGSGVVNFPMNRREFTERGVILGVNPRGPVDRSVPVLRVESPEGKLLGVVFGAACHNTTFGSRDNSVSGDFAGFSQAYLEREFPGARALFMQGLAGDANPYPNSISDPAKRPAVVIAHEHGAELAREVARVLRGTLKPINGPLRAALEFADLPLAQAPPQAELETLAAKGPNAHRFTASAMLAVIARGEQPPTHFRAPVAVWQFGDDLTWVGLSGEVVVDYVRLIEEALGPLKLWLSAYCNDVFGYIPSARVIREGGYETRGLYHGGPGFFAPEAEAVLVEKVRELSRRAGRAQ